MLAASHTSRFELKQRHFGMVCCWFLSFGLLFFSKGKDKILVVCLSKIASDKNLKQLLVLCFCLVQLLAPFAKAWRPKETFSKNRLFAWINLPPKKEEEDTLRSRALRKILNLHMVLIKCPSHTRFGVVFCTWFVDAQDAPPWLAVTQVVTPTLKLVPLRLAEVEEKQKELK